MQIKHLEFYEFSFVIFHNFTIHSAKCKNNRKTFVDLNDNKSKPIQKSKVNAENLFEGTAAEKDRNGDVADILEETIQELNGIISSLKKIST